MPPLPSTARAGFNAEALWTGEQVHAAPPIQPGQVTHAAHAAHPSQQTHEQAQQVSQQWLQALSQESVRLGQLHQQAARQQAQKQTQQQAQLLQQAVFNALPMLIAVLDRNAQVLQANAACQRFAQQQGFVRANGLVGVPYRELLQRMMGEQEPGEPCSDKYTEALQAAVQGIADVLSGVRSSFQMEHCVALCPDAANGARDDQHNALHHAMRGDGRGDVHWFTMQVAPVAGQQGQVVVSHQDISQIKAVELACRAMANVDELTGALSRRNFLSVAQQELQRALRYNMPLIVLMLDLDHFKQINDSHGHATGDAVLKGFVQTVAAVLRTQDVMGRLGGEEFCVLLPNTTPEGGYALAQRIVETVDKSPVRVGLRGNSRGKGNSPCDSYSNGSCSTGTGTDKGPVDMGYTVNYTVSIGACCLAGEHAFADLLHQADLALYRAKKGGRNRVVLQPPPDGVHCQ